MTVFPIFRDVWKVYIVAGPGNFDPLADESIPFSVRAQTLAFFQHISGPHGTMKLTKGRNHWIVKNPLILQLNPRHPYRIPYFFDSGNLIICTHIFEKAGGAGKTPKSEKKKAIDIRKAYFAAQADKTLLGVHINDCQ